MGVKPNQLPQLLPEQRCKTRLKPPQGWAAPSAGNIDQHKRAAALGFVPMHDARLHTPAAPAAVGVETDTTVAALLDAAIKLTETYGRVGGIAANQIGKPLAVAIGGPRRPERPI